ncbi:MAG: cysteine desulfurase NifS [Bacillota bacterium]|jgi:cysteine desulfurase|nr:cysteine desulfurase NifS [Bacillota bacterium]MDI9415346.1 cysteine desulfurase NifS [Bacillota bacterium]NLD13398.1 cysteine desulfurase NifS [Bacillota bacterium]HCD42119.1 cysteine desulfurase NifS [Bacillota bacterium]HOB88083.1 cysteine desulfurase NifS [Bacillota bacterium]
MKLVYLDNAATTKPRQEVVEAILPFLGERYGNPSSIYSIARDARAALDEARTKVAKAINARPEEIIFTGSGTEADNMAVKGVAYANSGRGKHIITSAIEHHAVLDSVKRLEKQGFQATFLPVDSYGMVDPKDVEAAITDDTILISIMHANNEVGTIQPIEEIARIAKKHGVLFHTDAVQTVGHIPVDVKELGVDLLSLSGHKFKGPKGVGALWVRKGVKMERYIDGGGQERNKRAGTENVPGIVGLSVALELAVEELEEEMARLADLRDYLIKGITDRVPNARLTGHPVKRLPGNASFCFEFIEGESLLLSLDAVGICGSSGSACTSGSLDPSHVLLAMGLPHEIAHGSLRLSLGHETTRQDLDYVLDMLPGIVQRLRDMSPLGEGISFSDSCECTPDEHSCVENCKYQ